jgi:hypothetical protein
MAKLKAKEEGEKVPGTSENDTITGLGGNEKLLGKDGNDKIKGRAGNDLLDGGDDNDRLFGDDGNDKLKGRNGNDKLFGGDDNDKLDGGDDDDKLFGEDGNDKLKGGKGDDRLDGGEGKNTLTGGAGSDRFDITGTDEADKIKDYDRDEDQLNLSSLLPNFGKSGDVLGDFVQVDERTGETRISVDLDGTGGDFVTVARLRGVTEFDDPTPEDFGLPVPGTPVVDEGISPQEAFEGATYNFTVPSDAFSDPDGDNLTYEFQLADGGTLPNWINNIRPNGFSGTPRGIDKATHDIRVTASDGQASASASMELTVTVAAGVDVPGRQSQAGNSADDTTISRNPSISVDGRFVAFDTFDSDLDITNFHSVFIRDSLSTDPDPVRVSPEAQVVDGALLNGAADPAISATGRFVAYQTFVSDADPNDDMEIDTDARQIDIVDLTQPDVFIAVVRGNADSSNPAISGDGARVAFQSDATDLSIADQAGSDVFVKDLIDDSLILISAAEDGEGGSGDSTNPAISANGRFVAFQSEAANLVDDDANGALSDIFIKDVERADIVRIDTPTKVLAQNPDISADGRFVVFETFDPDGGVADGVYLADRRSPDQVVRLARFELDASDSGASDFRANPSISDDGMLVSYLRPNEDGKELVVQKLSSSGEPRGNARPVVLAESLLDLDLSGDGDFVAFVSSDSIGQDVDNGQGNNPAPAVFTTPIDELLIGENLDAAALGTAGSIISMDQVLVAPPDEPV